MKEITELLNQGVKQGDFPGAAYAVVYKNGLIDKDFVGYKQIYPKQILNNGSELYDVASLTKVIVTTTLLMKLIENKKTSLNSKISDILPNFKHKEVTIFDLLTHSSGLLADIPNAKTLRNKSDVLNKVFSFDLEYPTGKNVVYSDIGFIILGIIVEKLSKKTLNEFAKEIIFRPLKMKDTSFFPDKSRSAPTEYRNDEVYTGLLKGIVHDEKAFALGGVSGHAGMFSTTDDLSKFILSILNNDELILKKETVDMLFIPRIEVLTDKGSKIIRALGWDKPTKGSTAGDYVSFEDTILHTGFTGCNLWIDRSRGIGFVMLSNAVHPHRENNNIRKYRNKIGNIILPNKEKSQ